MTHLRFLGEREREFEGERRFRRAGDLDLDLRFGDLDVESEALRRLGDLDRELEGARRLGDLDLESESARRRGGDTEAAFPFREERDADREGLFFPGGELRCTGAEGSW